LEIAKDMITLWSLLRVYNLVFNTILEREIGEWRASFVFDFGSDSNLSFD